MGWGWGEIKRTPPRTIETLLFTHIPTHITNIIVIMQHGQNKLPNNNNNKNNNTKNQKKEKVLERDEE